MKFIDGKSPDQIVREVNATPNIPQEIKELVKYYAPQYKWTLRIPPYNERESNDEKEEA